MDRNPAIGIRTRATQSSDEAWVVGHCVGRPWLLTGAICGYGLGLVTLVTAIAQPFVGRPWLLTRAICGYALVIAAVVVAAVKADRAARAIDPSETTR